MPFGPPLSDTAVRLVLLGSGELGREVAIEAIRLGCEVVAVDRYDDAPAMQVAHRRHVIAMTDADALRAVLEQERARPSYRMLVVPELEAIATDVLVELEEDGLEVVPTARAARLTMDREGIRRLAAEELGLPTSPYRFCDTLEEAQAAVQQLGAPCVMKPVMSSSGKGQSVVTSVEDTERAWEYAASAGRTGAGRVIVEGFVDFAYEITLLTVRSADDTTTFCRPIGHTQEGGDYRESWQPHAMDEAVLTEAKRVAQTVTGGLGGSGIFGVELFVTATGEVLFSEVSPRPHDTGMVTMASQQLSEFALHVRAILGFAIPADRDGFVPLIAAGASAVVLADSEIDEPQVGNVAAALATGPTVQVRIFGKPDARPGRRMGVALATADDVDAARALALDAASTVTVS